MAELKTYVDTGNRCARCHHHFADHAKMVGPCGATYWVHSVPTMICQCEGFVRADGAEPT